VQPYFLSYQLTDNHAITISGSFGTLVGTDDRHTRVLDIDLRVGDYALDNSHSLRGGDFSMQDFGDTSSTAPSFLSRTMPALSALRSGMPPIRSTKTPYSGSAW